MQHVVVTGATQGLGRALVDAYLARGHAVSFCGRRTERIAEINSELAASIVGDRWRGTVADVTEHSELQTFHTESIAHFGPVDLWINNAGFARGGGSFAQLPDADLEAMFETNLLGTARTCRLVLESMRGRGSGCLYNIVGAGADGRHVPGMLGYATTKCALQFLTDGLAREHAGTGVTIGSISPGLVLTEAVAREMSHIPATVRATRLGYLDVIGELPGTTADWIASETLRAQRNGIKLIWLTSRKLLARKLTRRIAPRDVVQRSGLFAS